MRFFFISTAAIAAAPSAAAAHIAAMIPIFEPLSFCVALMSELSEALCELSYDSSLLSSALSLTASLDSSPGSGFSSRYFSFASSREREAIFSAKRRSESSAAFAVSSQSDFSRSNIAFSMLALLFSALSL